ncbi:hypothetical protein TNCV_2420171 [Trichonephila clavipes]|nr:hypothetical protein TNCV_2420171 [Trichonephila clavipes]
MNDETMEATREMKRESPQEMDEIMEFGEIADGENGIEAGEDQMAGGENGIAVGEDQMADGENGIEAGEDENDAGENNAGWENLFQVVNESTFKSYFNNEQGESFTQLPQTIHITRSLNPRIMIVVPDE